MNKEHKNTNNEFQGHENHNSGAKVAIAVLVMALGLGVAWYAPALYKNKDKLLPKKEIKISVDATNGVDTTIYLGPGSAKYPTATHLRLVIPSQKTK